jgi:hypothetical protein
MRLSLRTLLGYEDKVFDAEQQRQVERMIQQHDAAGLTLHRIRAAVRNPKIAVPGRVQNNEELDPNIVAEYIDDEMQPDVQERFENFCLSSDKFLAEIASVHQILSGVLGEPARTSRECRLRCYKIVTKTSEPEEQKNENVPQPETPPKAPLETLPKTEHLEIVLPPVSELLPIIPPEVLPVSKRKTEPKEPAATAAKQKIPSWIIAVLLILPLGFFAGRNFAPPTKPNEAPLHQPVSAVQPNDKTRGETRDVELLPPQQAPQEAQPHIAPPNEKTAAKPVPPLAVDVPAKAPAAIERPKSVLSDHYVHSNVQRENIQGENGIAPSNPPQLIPPNGTEENPEQEEFDPRSLIAFQPIMAPPMKQPNSPLTESRHLEVLPLENNGGTNLNEPIIADVPVRALNQAKWSVVAPENAVQASQTVVAGQLTEAKPDNKKPAVKCLGKAAVLSEGIIFSAETASEQWSLKTQPFDLSANQYLLTIAPYRTELQLENGVRLEMTGDSKMCLLPPDELGTPGFFVDYGRIVITNAGNSPKALRIQTEKSEGVLTLMGKSSVAFIDTFAEIVESKAEAKREATPILGFLPDNGEKITWIQLDSQGQWRSVVAEKTSSLPLLSQRFELGDLQAQPAWLQRQALPREAELFAKVCRRAFEQQRNDCEKALEKLSGDSSPLVRSFGFRLWGDLGRFDLPLAVLEDTSKENEAIRQVLTAYFQEVKKRDRESVQRLNDAVKK